jgi:amidohydrolase
MIGTIRTYDESVRGEIFKRIKRTAEGIAQAAGATVDVEIGDGYPVTVNDPSLTARMIPTLQRAAGASKVAESKPSTAAEDFSRFAQKAPGLFVSLGVTPPSIDWHTAAANHSPLFVADEAALPIGVRVMTGLALDYLTMGKTVP